MLANALKKATTSATLESDIEFVSALSTTRTGTLPTHAVGDLIVAWALNIDSADTVAIPSGWTSFAGGGGGTIGSSFFYPRGAYKIAASTSEAPAWSSFVDIVSYIVLRNATSPGAHSRIADWDAVTAVKMNPLTFTELSGSSALFLVVHLRNENDVVVDKPASSYERYSNNVGSHQGIIFFKKGINYFPGMDLGTSESVSDRIAYTTEILE
jgi:hypothetical protein